MDRPGEHVPISSSSPLLDAAKMPLESNLDQRLAADAEDVRAERRLKEAVRRYYALAELIDTERGYVDDLKILVEVSETFHSARLVLFSFPRSFHIFFLVPCCGAMFCSPPHGCVYAYHPHICAGNVLSRRDLDPGTGDKPSEMRFASRECFSSILVFHTFPFRHRAFPLFVRLPTQRRRPHKRPRGGNDSSSMSSSPLSTTIARSDTRWRLLASHYLSS